MLTRQLSRVVVREDLAYAETFAWMAEMRKRLAAFRRGHGREPRKAERASTGLTGELIYVDGRMPVIRLRLLSDGSRVLAGVGLAGIAARPRQGRLG